MSAGRRKKYRTKKALRDAIEAYFDENSTITTAVDGDGNIIYSVSEEPITYVEYVRPIGVTGLCLHLGISRQTWAAYRADNAFKDICADAEMIIENYLEGQLVSGKGNQRGIIFNLQNNFGWREKKEVEVGPETRKSQIGLREKLAVIAEASEALKGDTGAES